MPSGGSSRSSGSFVVSMGFRLVAHTSIPSALQTVAR